MRNQLGHWKDYWFVGCCHNLQTGKGHNWEMLHYKIKATWNIQIKHEQAHHCGSDSYMLCMSQCTFSWRPMTLCFITKNSPSLLTALTYLIASAIIYKPLLYCTSEYLTHVFQIIMQSFRHHDVICTIRSLISALLWKKQKRVLF